MANWTPDFARRSSVDDVVQSINDILASSDTITTTPTTSRWNAGPAISPLRIMQIHPVLSGSAAPVGPMSSALNDTLSGRPTPTEPLQGRQGVEQARIEPLNVRMPRQASGGPGIAQAVQAAKAAGFTGDQLVTAVAVALAESGGNPGNLNDNPRTGDLSYGLFQINMLGGMGPERRKKFGLRSNEDLYNPITNARIAYEMSNGGRNWRPWSAYTNGSYQRYIRAAQAAVAQYSGDTGYQGDVPPTPSPSPTLEVPAQIAPKYEEPPPPTKYETVGPAPRHTPASGGTTTTGRRRPSPTKGID